MGRLRCIQSTKGAALCLYDLTVSLDVFHCYSLLPHGCAVLTDFHTLSKWLTEITPKHPNLGFYRRES